jgi:hypothetical protein
MIERSNKTGWGRALFYGFLTQVLAILTSILVITLYAFYLGFKARGAPDQTLINKFADASAPRVIGIAGIILVLIFACLISMKRETGRVAFGFGVGLCAMVFYLVSSLLLGSDFGLHTAVVVIFLIIFGWLGAVLGARP